MVFKHAMAELLGMFCIIQLIIYFPLIHVKFPSTALKLNEAIISVVAFDLLPTDDLYPVWFGF
jgi:hypothetical protein